MKIRNGVLQETRVDYFKGTKLIKFLTTDLLSKADPKLPPVASEAQAIAIGNLLLKTKGEDGQPKYFIQCNKVKPRTLELTPKQNYEELGYYTWIYEGSQTLSNFMTFLIIAGFLAITCFPIWPHFLKVWLWYVSVTLLSFMLGFLLLRFLAFLFVWVTGYEFWFLPNLFDESLSFVDSFKPLYSWEKSPPGQGLYRAGVVVAFVAFLYWAYSQPTEFDSLLTAQKQFMHDLYEGNLLSDVAQSDKDDIDKPRAYPSYEELLRESELDLAGADALSDEERGDSVIDSLLGEDEAEDAADDVQDAAAKEGEGAKKEDL